MEEIIEKTFDISSTLAKDFIASHFLSQSPQILRIGDCILTIKSFSRTSCYFQSIIFLRSCGYEFLSHIQNMIIYPQDVFGVLSIRTIYTTMT